VKRRVHPEELRLWSIVTATVRPPAGRKPARIEVAPTAPIIEAKQPPPPPGKMQRPPKPAAAAPPPKPKPPPPIPELQTIEPGRKRRLTRERDMIELRLDLHGLDQDRARAALVGFLTRAQAEGERAVLVITGKGWLGDGVLRRRTPEWLSDPALRHVVAGVSEAHRRHGGQGALYVALKRRQA
jgi:DNA-nicking Smr family endonuclease